MPRLPRQHGNILFLILLAVVLFAALAYAVTSSMRGGGKDASREKYDTLAAQMVQHFALLEQTMMRARLMNDVPEWGFDVSGASTTSRSTANATCTTAACKIYTDTGGPVPPLTIPDWASLTADPVQRRANWYVLSILNVGTPAPDIVVSYTYLTRGLCEAFNRIVGATDVNLVPTDSLTPITFYSATLTSIPASTSALGDEAPDLIGRRAVCHHAGIDIYRLFYTIMER